jgi:iron(II)-dependent oxidoreductase
MTVGDTTPVGRYPGGKSPYGLLDMAGNVWEWTSSLWGRDVNKPEFGYPYDPKDGRENQNAPDSVRRVLRGGSFGNGAHFVRCAYRNRYFPYYRFDFIGFRVASPGC